MEQELRSLSGLLGERDAVCSTASESFGSPEQYLSKPISRQGRYRLLGVSDPGWGWQIRVLVGWLLGWLVGWFMQGARGSRRSSL